MNLPDEQGRSKSVIELFESFFDEVQGEALSDDERAMLVDAVGVMARDGFSVEGRRVRLGSRPGS